VGSEPGCITLDCARANHSATTHEFAVVVAIGAALELLLVAVVIVAVLLVVLLVHVRVVVL